MLKKLAQENLKTVVNENEFVLIDFYHPSNILSEMLYHVMKQVRRNISNHIIILTCEIEEDSEFKTTLGIKDLPAVIFFKQGEVTAKVSGFRRASTIVDMINKQICN